MAVAKEYQSCIVTTPDSDTSPDEARYDTGNNQPVISALKRAHKETYETKPEWTPPKRGRRHRRWILCEHCTRWFAGDGPRRYCTRKCCDLHAVIIGKFKDANNPRWLGGVSNDNMRYRNRQKERDPEKDAARRAVYEATRRGRLVRQPCEKCGAPNAHGHHDDGSKPLDVRWLCRKYHDEHHKAVDAPRRKYGLMLETTP